MYARSRMRRNVELALSGLFGALPALGLADAVVFQKFIQNIALHGGNVIVFEAADGSVARVIDDSTDGLKLNKDGVRLDAKAAEQRIKTRYATGSTAKQVWFRQGNEAFLAWEVTTSLADSGKPASPTGLETVIDARTGAMLSQRQLDSKTYQPGSPVRDSRCR